MTELTPRQIVAELDRYIIGQNDAKKSVAVALRNRWRSKQLLSEIKEEIVPKNILMIGPTGVGKTEIARRLAKLAQAPFVKVEATKFTEVGYVGRDVEGIIRDLMEVSFRMVKSVKTKQLQSQAEYLANEIILDILRPLPQVNHQKNPFDLLFPQVDDQLLNEPVSSDDYNKIEKEREKLRRKLKTGKMETQIIQITLQDNMNAFPGSLVGTGLEDLGIQDLIGAIIPKKNIKRTVPIATARKILVVDEVQKLIDMDAIIAEAIDTAEKFGVIFIDEIDKIAVKNATAGPDVSREGVQRDILPIIEGSTVMTKYGPVKTDHILFIAAGAFHMVKPSDLIPELQGRFPIRVELTDLSKSDLRQILTQPMNALIKQYEILLATEGVNITFTDGAVDHMAEIAYEVNSNIENIGARRLHTILEKLLEDISFAAPEITDKDIIIDEDYVRQKLDGIYENRDLSQFIL